MAHSLALSRLQKSIRRHLGQGWQTAVFARPSADDQDADEEVVEGPNGVPDEAELTALLDRAIAAAKAGRVKHTYVLSEVVRVRIDARYGKAKIVQLDDEVRAKITGGKRRALQPDHSAPLLRQIGIMNADGSISAKHAKKYKQVNHFVELCRPLWKRWGGAEPPTDPIRVLDLGCGNGYLTFVLAEALRLASLPSEILGVDRREDVVERARVRAEALGWQHVRFERAEIATLPDDLPPPDLVVALHACDTATDDAIALGLRHAVGAMLVAPCCQHELAGQPMQSPLRSLGTHGLLRQEYASVLTDAIRVEWIEAHGYRVDLVEFVTSEHSAKNLLIRATRAGRGVDAARVAELRRRCDAFGVTPRLLGLSGST